MEIGKQTKEYGGPFTYSDDIFRDLKNFHNVDGVEELSELYAWRILEDLKPILKNIFKQEMTNLKDVVDE